jgi:hypothetical protein
VPSGCGWGWPWRRCGWCAWGAWIFVADGGPLPELAVVSACGRPHARRWRLVSVFARGWVVLVVALVNHGRLPLGRLLPEPWPVVPRMPEPAQAQSETKKVA